MATDTVNAKSEEIKAESVFVINKSDKDVKENKPGIGVVVIPANGEYEAKDVMGEFKTPEGKMLPYVRVTAKDLAESIVRDYGKPDVICLKEDREKVEKEIRAKLENEAREKVDAERDKEFRVQVEKEVKEKMEKEKKEKEDKEKKEDKKEQKPELFAHPVKEDDDKRPNKR